jgi:hypothetical protein
MLALVAGVAPSTRALAQTITLETLPHTERVRLYVAGSGKATIDWGDGSPQKTITLEPLPQSNWRAIEKGNDWKTTHDFDKTGNARSVTITGNVTGLSVDGIGLGSLDVTGMAGLEWLNCNYTTLATLDLSESISLRGLTCSHNNLTSLDTSWCRALEELSCHINQIRELDLRGNINLKYLLCSGNPLAGLDVRPCPLVSLSVRNCGLATIDVWDNRTLRSLDIMGNDFTELEIDRNFGLRGLTCSDNRFDHAAVVAILRRLPAITDGSRATISIGGNPGSSALTPEEIALATAKGWEVFK